jgi:bloom syndrome protein
MAGLDEMQRDVLHDFLNGAKKLRQTVMTNNGHRQTIFSDTILREMGLCLPADLEEMKTIPGINKDMVDRYGSKFMLLINNTRDMYGGLAPTSRNHPPQRRQPIQELSDDDYEEDDDDEEVYDPNRQQVIDLCESEEDIPVPVEDSESNYSYGESEDDDDHDERRSHFFTQALDPEVEEFNNRLTQTISANAANSKATTSKRAPRASSSGPKKRFSRKSGGSFGKGGYSGVKKRATSKATSSKAPAAPKRAAGGSSRGGGAGASARAGGGNNGWSSIMGMPT